MRKIENNELKNIQLEIMKDIHKFCEEEHICYSLCAGSLLGAVRHEGFIPWDDDIDIMMPRPDYDKFLIKYNQKKGKYNVVAYEIDKKCPYNYAKVYDNTTKLIENTDYTYNIGVNVDVFPVDGFKPKCGILTKQVFLRNILNIKILKINKKRNILKNTILRIFKIIMAPISIEFIVKAMCENQKKSSFNESEYVMCIYGVRNDALVNKKIFNCRKLVKFENYHFYIICEYDEWLRKRYGNYMCLPPLENQINHHTFEAYYL